ncbi:hypothetical protein [Vibrio atypicus]|uniref:hypothetical protein n=1 Tax=Vibrio atypicus TaxID=558271 RepID=UPI0013568420|nr:hypothetical protein [Vibrio atypicus]
MNIDQIYSNQSDYIQQLLQVSENGEVYGQYKGYTFHSVFQPILDQAGNIFGLEGLSRINSPKVDSVNPYKFFSS